MGKESGLGMTVSVDDSGGVLRDISNDLMNITIGTPREVQDITGLDKSAIERLLLRADAQITLNGVFNDAANRAHAVLKDVPSTSVTRTVTIAISGQTLSIEAVITDYALTRAPNGGFTFSAPCQLANGTAPAWS